MARPKSPWEFCSGGPKKGPTADVWSKPWEFWSREPKKGPTPGSFCAGSSVPTAFDCLSSSVLPVQCVRPKMVIE